MADFGQTWTSSMPAVEEKKFVCKRCKRVYPYPQAGGRPIRCECGWWYYNDGLAMREVFWQRLAPYRVPPELRHFFEPN